MQILRNAANFMFVNVFLYHFGSNFVRFERKKCHLCGTVWNMCRAERKKWGEMWETHDFFGVAFGRKGSKNAFVTSWKSVRGKSPKIQGIYFEIYGS